MRNIRKIVIALACAAMLALGATAALAAEPNQEKCPVMGYAVNKDLHEDYKGKRVYFCCASCPEEFKKNPEKYIKEMEDKGVVLEDAPSQ